MNIFRNVDITENVMIKATIHRYKPYSKKYPSPICNKCKVCEKEITWDMPIYWVGFKKSKPKSLWDYEVCSLLCADMLILQEL